MNELLKPRIKVIAPMPFMKNEVGSLLYRHDWKDTFSFGIKTEDAEHFYQKDEFEKWPHIFNELGWWEDLEEKDMPEYLKIAFAKNPEEVGFIFKVDRYEEYYISDAESPNECYLAYSKDISDCISVVFCDPATLEEYQSQKL